MHSSVGRANRLDEFLVTVPARTALVFKLCEVIEGGPVVAVSTVDIKALLNKKGVGVVDGLEVIRDFYSCFFVVLKQFPKKDMTGERHLCCSILGCLGSQSACW